MTDKLTGWVVCCAGRSPVAVHQDWLRGDPSLPPTLFPAKYLRAHTTMGGKQLGSARIFPTRAAAVAVAVEYRRYSGAWARPTITIHPVRRRPSGRRYVCPGAPL